MNPQSLNVYVRIRPFLIDELQRNENTQLIDILDEKHISVKIPSRNLQLSYNQYEVTRIFNENCSQQELFEQILEEPTNEIFTGSNWLFCTFGLTNSGKTHTMFGTDEQPGLIPKCLRRIFLNIGQNIDNRVLFKPIGLENFISTNDCNLNMEIIARNYIFKDEKSRLRLPNLLQEQNHSEDLTLEDENYSIWISFFELYNENILDLLVQPKDMKTRKNLRLVQNDHSSIIKNLIQIPVFNLDEAENIIKFGFSNRSTSKTNLNEASSRSHAIICITLITINEFDEQPTMSHMYICDLAGNEPSTSLGKQLIETCNINTSLMTFKDCIRILNENQSTKKQMLIPYRQSVLTSIFRPFFVGRGRTIICCNLNPCATFINQTNDLLKFCSLAQKTIIVSNESKTNTLIKQQRKSKNKSRKRLERQNISKEKNISQNLEFQSTERKSLNYWKNCTKQAVDLLQKQATNRHRFLIERHQERVQTVQYLLHLRQLNDNLTHENQLLFKQNENLTKDLRLEQDKHFLNEKQSREKFSKFEQLICEYLQTIERIDEEKKEYQEEIQRLKRDLGLELYRKQDAEKKARLFEDKFHHEQISNQKTQYDLTKIKFDFQTLQVKYDALQLEMIDLHQTTREKSTSEIRMVDDRTSATTVHEEQQSIFESNSKTKRITNDDEQENKKQKRIIQNVSIPIEQIKIKSENKIDSKIQEPDSPIYATIQRKTSIDKVSFTTVAVPSPTVSISVQPPAQSNETPKTSTFKRIQSFFRVTPTSTNSAKLNRIMQVKSTAVAFGSSTPTNRVPPSIIKTPAAKVQPTPTIHQLSTPKPKYNLRTRLLNNPVVKDEEQKKIQTKKPVRARK